MAKPFISAYKAGSTSVADHITDDQIVYWYRPAPKDIDCDATDTTLTDANNSSGNYFKGIWFCRPPRHVLTLYWM